MVSVGSNLLVWQVLALCLVASRAGANLRELRHMLERAYAAETDDEDLLSERQLLSGSGSGSGNSGNGGGPEVEVCDAATLARKCAGVCGRAHCSLYPEATCAPADCEHCTPVWTMYGKNITDCNSRPLECPGLWVPKGGHCYRVQNRYGLDFKSAQKYCLRQGGHLAAIETSAEQTSIESLLLLNGMSYWTAGYKHSSSFVWQLPDGNHPLRYTYWASGEPNNEGYRGFPEDRIALKQSGRRWKWNDASNFIKYYPICEALPDKLQTLCDSKPCMNGGKCVFVSEDMYRCDCSYRFSGKYCELSNDNSNWSRFQGHLYLVITDFGLNHQDATAYCAMHNAYMLSINTEEESDYVKGLLDKRGVSDPTHAFYTGGYKSYPNSVYKIQWADGTTLGSEDFKDWGPGEPNRSSERYIMLKFFTEHNQWRWNDSPENWIGDFICEKSVTWQAKRNSLGEEYNSGMMKKLFQKRWLHPDSTKEY